MLICNELNLRRVSYTAGNRLLGWALSKISVFNRLRSALCLIAPSLPLALIAVVWGPRRARAGGGEGLGLVEPARRQRPHRDAESADDGGRSAGGGEGVAARTN